MGAGEVQNNSVLRPIEKMARPIFEWLHSHSHRGELKGVDQFWSPGTPLRDGLKQGVKGLVQKQRGLRVQRD